MIKPSYYKAVNIFYGINDATLVYGDDLERDKCRKETVLKLINNSPKQEIQEIIDFLIEFLQVGNSMSDKININNAVKILKLKLEAKDRINELGFSLRNLARDMCKGTTWLGVDLTVDDLKNLLKFIDIELYFNNKFEFFAEECKKNLHKKIEFLQKEALRKELIEIKEKQKKCVAEHKKHVLESLCLGLFKNYQHDSFRHKLSYRNECFLHIINDSKNIKPAIEFLERCLLDVSISYEEKARINNYIQRLKDRLELDSCENKKSLQRPTINEFVDIIVYKQKNEWCKRNNLIRRKTIIKWVYENLDKKIIGEIIRGVKFECEKNQNVEIKNHIENLLERIKEEINTKPSSFLKENVGEIKINSDYIIKLTDTEQLANILLNGIYCYGIVDDGELYVEFEKELSFDKRNSNRERTIRLFKQILSKDEMNNLIDRLNKTYTFDEKEVSLIRSIVNMLGYFPKTNFNDLSVFFYNKAAALGWHEEEPDFASFCMNMHSEIDEMWEAYRENRLDKPCDKEEKMKALGLEVLTAKEEEMADILIRTFDMAETFGVDLDKAIKSKALFNDSRGYKHGGKKC